VIDLRLGHYRDVCADVQADALISDPPYGTRTHEGHDDGAEQVVSVTGQTVRRSLSYWWFSESDVAELVEFFAPRVRGWMCFMTSHDLIPAYERAMEATGRYVFAPVPIFQKRPRLLGDGPANWTIYMVVSRPRTVEFSRWGCLPGHYESHCEKGAPVVGAKPVSLLRRIVSDYTKPNDLIVDPCSGGGSTLLAARLEGRRAIGAEIDPNTHAKALERLAGERAPTRQQPTLFDEVVDAG
jgi:hypothetical protein